MLRNSLQILSALNNKFFKEAQKKSLQVGCDQSGKSQAGIADQLKREWIRKTLSWWREGENLRGIIHIFLLLLLFGVQDIRTKWKLAKDKKQPYSIHIPTHLAYCVCNGWLKFSFKQIFQPSTCWLYSVPAACKSTVNDLDSALAKSKLSIITR